MLTDRRSECDVLEGLIEAVRAGESRALVVRGEPGKTALLTHLIEQASGCRVARAAGVQSEMELAFAASHQLLAPMMDRAERLPAPQRDALRTAFGLGPGSVPDRFFVALAVLSLLSDVAEDELLICHHLHKVFAKLDISSRNQLHRALGSDPGLAPTGDPD